MRMREVYDLDHIVQNFVKPEAAVEYEFTTSLGIAKDGTPIRYSRFGAGDLHGFLMCLSGYQICLYCSYLIECDMDIIRRENRNRKGGREVHQVTYVIDLEHFSLQTMVNKAVIEMGLDLLQVMQDHCPEIWGNILVVNAPSYFDRVFNIFKPLLRLNLLRKIRVASSESTPALLLKYIDPDVLPTFLGGKRVVSLGDRNSPQHIPAGGPIPEQYYLRNEAPLLQPSDEGASSTWVSARAVHNYSAVVHRAHSTIRLDFRTENGGIGLKMLFRPMGSDPSQLDLPAADEYLDDSHPGSNVQYVSPYIRMQSHTTPVIGQSIGAPWPGIYIFRFDNTHSWFRSKRIIFRVRVIED